MKVQYLRISLLLVLVTLVFLAVSAHALPPVQDMEPVPHPDASDWFIQHGDWWFVDIIYNGAGNISTVDCRLAGGCWTCLPNTFGKWKCAYGVTTGACNCADVQRQNAGPGITDCRLLDGACFVRTTP